MELATAGAGVDRRGMERDITVEQFAEKAGKIIDLKAVCKPSLFSGEDARWPEWRYKTENMMKLIGLSELAKDALKAEEHELEHAVMSTRAEAASTFLHGLLVNVVTGKALTIVKLAGENGFLAWKRLVQMYEPKRALRHTAMLRGILNPAWTDKKDFTTQWLEWEREVEEYEEVSGQEFRSPERCATVYQ
jgi:hypothetical protein